MESEDGMDEIGQLLNDYTSLQAAHRSLLERCENQSAEVFAEAQGEMDVLRNKVKDLQEELAKVTGERDELSATVRDLRVRVEESRRAIMRLQGGGIGAAAAGQAGSSSGSSTVGAANHPNRRSVGPAALSSWNPKEVTSSGMALNATSPDTNYSHHTPEEAAELKKSKRASLAFGPNAQGTIGRRAHGHRRIASGSRIGINDEEGGQTVTAPSQGLRELHLGGTTPVTATNGQSNKRSSYYGGVVNNLFSPSSDTSDLPPEESTERTGSLLMPNKTIRRASNSSSLSGSIREGDGETGLAVPSSISRTSLSPSPSSMTSPILETEEGEGSKRSSRGYRDEEQEEPWTARPIPNTGVSSMSGAFSSMQQTTSDYSSQLQRQLAEQKFRVQDRDNRLNEMRREMHALRLELDDAKEARLASEACLKALRDFVKDEGGRSTDSDGGAQTLKGVKLPPLPTDQDTDELSSDSVFLPITPGRNSQGTDVNTPTQANTTSTWKAFGSTFASLSRAKSDESTGISNSTIIEADPSGDRAASTASTAPLSPSAQLGSSIGTLWSRATTKRESVNTVPSESNATTNVESRHTSMTSNSQGDLTNTANTANTATSSAPSTAFKGFGWFNKRPTGDESSNEVASPPVLSTRVSSPPFANLDNHVLTLDQIQSGSSTMGTRKASMTESSNASQVSDSSTISFEPNDRVRKAREKSGVVDEDTGFVPPTF